MSGISFEVHKDTSVLSRIIQQIQPRAEQNTLKAADDMAQDIHNNWSGYYPPASVPGEPPAVRSGTLDKSTGAVPEQSLKTGKITSMVRVTAFYASFLEYGTRKTAARPFVRPAIKRMSKTFGRYFRTVMRP